MLLVPRNRKLARWITVWDVAVVVVLAGAALIPWLTPRRRMDGVPHILEIVTESRTRAVVSLGTDGRYRIPGPLGESVAQVVKGRVHMLSSPCPNQACVREGWKGDPGQMIICAPNRVGLFIKGEGGRVDAVSH